MAMYIIFFTMYVDEDLSNVKSSSIDKRGSDDLTKSPRVLIERLMNLMFEKVGVRSDMREWCFAFLGSLLIRTLESNSTIGSRI